MYRHRIELRTIVYFDIDSDNKTITEEEVNDFVTTYLMDEDGGVSLAEPVVDGHHARLYTESDDDGTWNGNFHTVNTEEIDEEDSQ